MTCYTELSKKYNEFIAMTGLSVDEFDSLLFYFKKAETESKFTIAGKERERKHAVYKNSPIKCSADRLLFILIYMKQYMTQTATGQLFGISQPKANMFMPLFDTFIVGSPARIRLLSMQRHEKHQ